MIAVPTPTAIWARMTGMAFGAIWRASKRAQRQGLSPHDPEIDWNVDDADREHDRAHPLSEHGDQHEREREDREGLHHVRDAQAEARRGAPETVAALP